MPKRRRQPEPVDYSQHGEQLLILETFGDRSFGFAVDVGASNGISCSNTKWLEDIGWDVLCVEPNPKYRRMLKANRKHSMILAVGDKNLDRQPFTMFEIQPGNFEAYSSLDPRHSREARAINKLRAKQIMKVSVRTLDWCIERAGFPRLDMVSIDVEGTEQNVLNGFSINRWAPRMVIIEDWKGGQYREWFCRRGYYVRKRLGPNEIFLRCDG